jgi:hypothetical protein
MSQSCLIPPERFAPLPDETTQIIGGLEDGHGVNVSE